MVNDKLRTRTTSRVEQRVVGVFVSTSNSRWCYVLVANGDRRELVKDLDYKFQPRSDKLETGWKLKNELVATRKQDFAR
jgi:hypothetical protein